MCACSCTNTIVNLERCKSGVSNLFTFYTTSQLRFENNYRGPAAGGGWGFYTDRMIFQEKVMKSFDKMLCVCISSPGRCERAINSVFTCCLKHISDRENRSNDFNDFFSSASLFFTFIQSITTSVCSAAAGAAPCLRAEECMRMRNVLLIMVEEW